MFFQGNTIVRVLSKNNRFLFSVVLLTSLHIRCVSSSEIQNNMMDKNGDDILAERSLDVKAVEYLERYGYLSRRIDDKQVEPTHSQVDKDHAVRTFQLFANVEPTGQVDLATSDLMSKPRCGFWDILPNTDRTLPLKLENPAKWESEVVKWKITAFSKKLTIEQQRKAIENSFRVWTDNSGLTVQETLEDDADIEIQFAIGDHGDGKFNAFDGKGKAVAHAFLPPDGRAHFDDDEDWTFHNNNGTEFEMTAIHELGHSLGLIHSTARESIMAPFYKKHKSGFKLHPLDVLAIQELYGPPPVKADVAPTQSVTDTTTTVTTLAAETSTIKTSSIGTTLQTDTTTTYSSTKATTLPNIVQKKKAKKRKEVNVCTSRFDALCGGKDGYINLFMGRNVYKLFAQCVEGQNCILEGYPKLIRSVYKKGPRRVRAAAYIPGERKHTYLFKGRKVWRYTGSKLDSGFPIKMSRNDLPYKPSAAFAHRTSYADYQLFLFHRNYFWEMNMDSNKMADHSLSYTDTYWNHMPKKQDAIIQTKDGNIYVFKGKHYRKYDHRRGIVSMKNLKSPAWIGRPCGFGNKDYY